MAASQRPTAVPFYQVDAFTAERFGGNPAAVCLLPRGLELSSETMQRVAAENNLSETAFLELDGDSSGDFATSPRFRLRWFTPTSEVPLCGHATLASAAALFSEAGNSSPELEFLTASGSLYVSRVPGGRGDASGGPMLEMRFPSLPPQDTVPSSKLASGSELVAIVAGGLPVEQVAWVPSVRYLVVRLADSATQEQLEALRPDMQAMQASTGQAGITGVIVTCRGAAADVASRFFAPWMGIPEDPVTGSAHSVLCPLWEGLLGRATLSARQCSPRGGDLEMEHRGEHVLIRGQAVTVIRGELLL